MAEELMLSIPTVKPIPNAKGAIIFCNLCLLFMMNKVGFGTTVVK
jgi:hypothetical protein